MQIIPKTRAADAATVELAARIVCQGGLVVFPTRGLYGLGANAIDPEAVRRVFSVKRRPPDKPVLVLVRQIGDVGMLVTSVTPAAHHLMDRFWPGRVTLVFNASPRVSPLLTGGTGKIGIRVPWHPVTIDLVETVGGPLTGTSANISGCPGCARIEDLDPRVAAEVDLVLDAGVLAGGVGSTVVDVSGGTPRVLREGAVSSAEIMASLGAVS
jgi:L-threonylcarbamoyladenylate synthase